MADVAKRSDVSGVVLGDAVYTLPEVQSRLGLGVHALRMARRAGLRVRRVGRRGFVLGRDLLAFIESASK